MRKRDPFFILSVIIAIIALGFIILPLFQMAKAPTLSALVTTLQDGEVMSSIYLSITTALTAATISLIAGTPIAYLLSRFEFRGKRLAESIIDLPIVIPHPVIGIAILSIVGNNHWIGRQLGKMGIELMGSPIGIVTVLTFVSMPFFIKSAKEGFDSVPVRLENVSRSLGASMFGTFVRITIPLSWKGIVVGFIMSTARAISEFGAVIIIAYHPKTAPVMIYERFENYGLKASQPISVWLIAITLLLFVALRILVLRRDKND